MTQTDKPATAALSALILLQGVMLSALYAGIAPHPPVATPAFGMAPFIAAAVSVAFGAILLGPLSTGAGRILSCIAVLLALVSFGPQKYLDAQFALIWPAVVTGQIAAATILYGIIAGPRSSKALRA